jgi:hypothetical protein
MACVLRPSKTRDISPGLMSSASATLAISCSRCLSAIQLHRHEPESRSVDTGPQDGLSSVLQAYPQATGGARAELAGSGLLRHL